MEANSSLEDGTSLGPGNEFHNKKSNPINPQSNPVERVMREIERIFRTYASDRQRTWYKILKRAEDVINGTMHASTGFAPNKIQSDLENRLVVDPALVPTQESSLRK